MLPPERPWGKLVQLGTARFCCDGDPIKAEEGLIKCVDTSLECWTNSECRLYDEALVQILWPNWCCRSLLNNRAVMQLSLATPTTRASTVAYFECQMCLVVLVSLTVQIVSVQIFSLTLQNIYCSTLLAGHWKEIWLFHQNPVCVSKEAQVNVMVYLDCHGTLSFSAFFSNVIVVWILTGWAACDLYRVSAFRVCRHAFFLARNRMSWWRRSIE